MRWTIGLALGSGCAGVAGDWEGDCRYEAGPGDRTVKLVVELDEPSDNGVGSGTARIIDDGERINADVVYQSKDNTVSIDLYPESGRDLFLRGQVRGGALTGSCGDEPPDTVNVDAALGCVAGVDPDCDEATEWQQGKRPAPVSSDDLSGRFTLDRS